MVSKQYAKANNPDIEGYDPEKQKRYLLYLDANNLYGWAMSQPLPTGGFQWEKDCKNYRKQLLIIHLTVIMVIVSKSISNILKSFTKHITPILLHQRN